MIWNFKIKIARFILSNYPFPRGIGLMTKLLLPNSDGFPAKASFRFKYGKFHNVSIKKWPWGYWDLFIYGVMEINQLYFWKKFIRKGDTVIDVGANYGYWTLVASNFVGIEGHVLAFEPIEKTFGVLLRNINASNVHNVKLNKLGLSNQNLKTTFHISSSDEIGSQSSQGGQAIVNFDIEQEVELVSLDSLINTDKRVSLIKIDIEGGELFALQGMEQLLRAQQPVVTFEWNVLTAQAMGYHPDEIINYMESLNYKIRIGENELLIEFEQEKYPKDSVLMLWAIPSNFEF